MSKEEIARAINETATWVRQMATTPAEYKISDALYNLAEKILDTRP